jgi:hypothetical protein
MERQRKQTKKPHEYNPEKVPVPNQCFSDPL